MQGMPFLSMCEGQNSHYDNQIPAHYQVEFSRMRMKKWSGTGGKMLFEESVRSGKNACIPAR